MTGDKEAEHLFFVVEPLALLPVRHARQIVVTAARRGRFVEESEKACLSLQCIALRFLRPLHRLVDGVE